MVATLPEAWEAHTAFKDRKIDTNIFLKISAQTYSLPPPTYVFVVLQFLILCSSSLNFLRVNIVQFCQLVSELGILFLSLNSEEFQCCEHLTPSAEMLTTNFRHGRYAWVSACLAYGYIHVHHYLWSLY